MSTNKKRIIDYWRKGMFEGLEDLAKTFSINPNYSKFVQFAKLREKGLRKQSLDILNDFIKEQSDKPFYERKEFVALFCETSLKWGGDSYLFSPHPLIKKLISPTVEEWINKEPEHAPAFRWAGIYCGEQEDGWKKQKAYFRRAVDLDPLDDYSRSRILNILLHEPYYSTHHLDESQYLGNPNEDLKFVEEAKREAENFRDVELKNHWNSEANEYESMILDWLEYSSQDRTVSFPQFTREKGRDYGWSEHYYYKK